MRRESLRLLLGLGYMVSLVVALLACLCLLLDLGRLEAIDYLITQAQLTYVNIGFLSLVLLLVFNVLLVMVWFFQKQLPLVTLKIGTFCTLVVALVTMLYTGLFLQSLEGVFFWQSPLVPVLFTVSSLSTGAALFCFIGFLSGALDSYRRYFKRLTIADVALIVIEVIVLAAFLFLALTNGDTLASAYSLVFGDHAFLFWVGLVGVGLLIPLGCEIASLITNNVRLAVAATPLIIAGGLVLRIGIVEAATHPEILYMMG